MTETLAVDLLRVHHPVRDPVPAQVPSVAGIILPRVPTVAVEAVVVSATKWTENLPPANAIIVTRTLRVRPLVRGLPWTVGTI